MEVLSISENNRIMGGMDYVPQAGDVCICDGQIFIWNSSYNCWEGQLGGVTITTNSNSSSGFSGWDWTNTITGGSGSIWLSSSGYIDNGGGSIGGGSVNYALIDPIVPIHGSTTKPTPLEAALMSRYVYGGSGTLEGNWKVSTAQTGLVYNSDSGFKSQLFERTVNGIKEYTYVTAGTDDFGDVAANILQLAGLSSQYEQSVANALELKRLFGDAISFAGHSLGGGLAEANAIATGVSAITFNAAGLSVLTTGISYRSDTDAYIMTTDPLNALQFQSTLLPSAGGEAHYLRPVSLEGVYNGHSIDAVIETLR